MKPKILGIAASLRNARWGIGNRNLIDELFHFQTRDLNFDNDLQISMKLNRDKI